MSNEQEAPRDDLAAWAATLDARRKELRREEGEFEQAVRERDKARFATYVRADASKFPTDLLGQQASVEGMAAALGDTEGTREHNRRRLAERRLEVDETAAGKLRAQMSALIEQYETDREAEQRQYEAAQGTGLDVLAEGFRKATSTAKRHDLAEAVGSSLPLAEAGVIRRAAKAVEEALPGTVVDARVDGWSAKEIAAELDVTPSYVYRMLRDHPWEAQWIMYVMPDGWTSDSDVEPWEDVAAGVTESPGETADQLASRILDERLDDDLATKRVRVCVWRTGDGNDPLEARGEAERDPANPDA